MNKIIIFIASILFISSSLFWVIYQFDLVNSDQQINIQASSEINIPISDVQFSDHQLIGDDTTTLKGVAFTHPENDLTPKSTAWISQPIGYSDSHKGADLVVTLGRQLYDLFFENIKVFSKIKNINIVVTKGTCGISSRNLKKKSIDVGGFCCPAGKSDRLPNLKYYTLGISAIALLTNVENPLTNITSDDARKVFSGKLRRWNQLQGGKDNNRGIMIATRLHCKTRPGHWKLILENEDKFSTSAKEMADIPYMLTQINRHSVMLGYETLFMVKREGKAVKTLQVNNINPGNLKALAKGYYPFYRTYNLAIWTGQQARPIAAELVAYLKNIVVKQSEKYQMVPITELEKYGWAIKDGELLGEPNTLQ